MTPKFFIEQDSRKKDNLFASVHDALDDGDISQGYTRFGKKLAKNSHEETRKMIKKEVQ